MKKKYFNIDEISKLTGEKKHTIRFWEERIDSLIVLRTNTGHRLYNYDNFLKIKKIQFLTSDKKLTLDGINKYFETKGDKGDFSINISLELKKILDKLKSPT